MIEALQACQGKGLIKAYLFVNGLFVKSIFHSKCHISLIFAMQIGWDIVLKYTWDFFALPRYTNLIGVRGKEDGWRLCGVCCQGTRRGCSVVLYLHEMSQIRNGSSRMDLNPDTSSILIHKSHRGWDTKNAATLRKNTADLHLGTLTQKHTCAAIYIHLI